MKVELKKELVIKKEPEVEDVENYQGVHVQKMRNLFLKRTLHV